MFSSSVFIPHIAYRTVDLFFFVNDCFSADLEYTGSPLQYPSTAAVDG